MRDYWEQIIAKFFDNYWYFIGPTQTYSNYKLDLRFTPAYVPFPIPWSKIWWEGESP